MGCPICLNEEAQVRDHSTRDASIVDCPQCANFTISRSAQLEMANCADNERWKISSWFIQYRPLIFTTTDVDSAFKSGVPSLHTRADRMLRWLRESFPPGKFFSIDSLGQWTAYKNSPDDQLVILGGSLTSSPLVPIGWNHDIGEMIFMVTEVLCNELGLLVSQNNHEYQVSPKGLVHLEGRKGEQSSLGFGAMWFDEGVKALWTDAIEPAIHSAGYEPLRIDQKLHNERIDDEIVASIRSARFVVADFTKHRGGVYYEAGLAHGLGLPVIFMCREDHLVELHFDIRQYNCIVWNPDALPIAQEALKNRILATLGQGPLKLQ